MSEIFYYIKNDELNSCINYGIKLSESHERKITINNIEKIFLIGLLNPKDNKDKYNDRNNYTCVRLLLDNINLKICEGTLYGTPYYEKSIINLNDYELGKYMNPEVLIPVSILPENIEQINYEIDYPILYNSSEELYINNNIETVSLKLDDSRNVILKSLLDEYAKKNNIRKEIINGVNIYLSYDNRILYICK